MHFSKEFNLLVEMKHELNESHINKQVAAQLKEETADREVISSTASYLCEEVRKLMSHKKHYLLVVDKYGRSWRITIINDINGVKIE